MKRFLLTSVFFLAVFHLFGCGEVINHNDLALNWTPPTINTDGTDLEDLCGYRIYYGNESGGYSNANYVSASYTEAVVKNLGPGTWYFSVTAYDFFGNESDFSNEVVHTFE